MSDSRAGKDDAKIKDVTEVSKSVEDQNEHNSVKSLSNSTELLVEFLSSIMTKDYEMALKYCMEILSHEPENKTALEFYPLIVEKMEMIKNEELDNTSSDSSLTSSASSSSSENGLFYDEILNSGGMDGSMEWNRSSHSSHADVMTIDKNNASVVSNTTTSEEVTSKDTDSNISSAPKSENYFEPLPRELNMGTPRNVTQMHSKLLIHPTQTITLFGKNVKNMESRTLLSPKQDKQTPTVSQEQSSKILLQTTRTITFTERPPTRNLTRAENPQ